MFARIRRSFRRRPWLWLAGGVTGLVVFGIVNVKATSHSSFCNSCHLMKPYYESWSRDDAHSRVECVKCHIAPGLEHTVHAKLDGFAQLVNDALGRSSTRPAAHVSDNACMRSGCHVTSELDRDDARRQNGAERPFLFSHEAHVGMEYLGIKVHCATCHSYTRGDVHFELNTNACFSCHLMDSGDNQGLMRSLADHGTITAVALAAHTEERSRASAECQTCHAAPSEPIRYNGMMIDHAEYIEHGASCSSCHQGVTSKPTPVDDSRCLNCHGFGMEQSLPVAELHRVHIEGRHKVQCFNCHGLVDHGPHVQMGMLEAELDCRSCHAGAHGLQRKAYQHHTESLEMSGDDSPVSPMFLAHVSCTSCHVEPDDSRTSPLSGAQVARATGEACDTCHRPGLGDRTIALWQRTTRELYQSVRDLMPTNARRARAGAEPTRLLDEADRILELVRLDGSWGVHNPRYTESLLEQARDNVLLARALMQEEGSR